MSVVVKGLVKLPQGLTKYHAMKVYPCLIKHHAIKTYCGSGGIAARVLNFSTRWK
jgi:hypothetical protein